MDDGVDLAATLYEPSAAPPPAGYPAIVLFHGLGGKRQDLDAVAQRFDGDFAVLAFDRAATASRAGSSRSTARARSPTRATVFDQLAARPEIDKTRDRRLGHLARRRRRPALARRGRAVGGRRDLRDVDRPLQRARPAEPGQVGRDLPVPELGAEPTGSIRPCSAIRDDALASRTSPRSAPGPTRARAASCSRTVKTPVFMFQGRRDFAFDIAQAKAGYALLKGPKRLYIGDFGHAPSTFPGPDFVQMTKLGLAWFTRYLGGAPTTIAPVSLAPSPWRGKLRSFAKLPADAAARDRPARQRPPRRRRPRAAHERPLHRQRRDLRLGDRAGDRALYRRLVAPRRRADRASRARARRSSSARAASTRPASKARAS